MRLWEKIPYDNISVITAHPDDEILGAGGTILKAIDEGKDISIIFMTDGSGSPYWREKEKNVWERITEIRKLYRKLGVRKVFFLGYPDTMLSKYITRASNKLLRYLEMLDPDLVISHYPDSHKDHRATHEIAKDVVEELEKEAIFFKINGPKIFEKVRVAVDITKYYKKKFELLKFYKSQLYLTIPIAVVSFLDDLLFQFYFGKKVEVFL